MGVLGKDLFDLHRPQTNTKVEFGASAYRRFGERLSVGFVFLFAQLCIEAAEVFRPQIDQLVAAEIRFEAFNILLLAHERGLRRPDRFLLRISPLSVGRVAHRDDE